MGYLKLSEFQAKKLYSIFTQQKSSILNHHLGNLPDWKSTNYSHKWVIKVDNGTKRRMKRGLVKIGLSLEEANNWILERGTNENYVIEPQITICEEIYILIRPFGLSNEMFINFQGGINADTPLKNASRFILPIVNLTFDDFNILMSLDNISLVEELFNIYMFFCKYNFTFLEVNPLVKTNLGEYKPLDFAILWDTTSSYLFQNEELKLLTMNYFNKNSVLDLVDENNGIEKRIAELDSRTGGSLKFNLINPNGSIWTLVAGGGASVAYTDAIINRGYFNELANYGEYSGDPQEELVYLYCLEIFNEMKKTSDLNKKTLFIGGGIANFTDVKKTFAGILKAIEEKKEVFQNNKVDIWIRRGGPNYESAFKHLREVFNRLGFTYHLFGPETPITEIVIKALPFKESNKHNDNNGNVENVVDVPEFLNDDDDNELNNKIEFNFGKCILYGYHQSAVQRMLDFDTLCGNDKSVCAVVEPRKSNKTYDPFFHNNKAFLMPIYNDLKECVKNETFSTVICFMSFRSTYNTCRDIFDNASHCVKHIIIIAEGVAENETRKIEIEAKQKGITIYGPATVGGIFPEQFRIANTGGSIDNLLRCRVHQKGSVAFATRSGGLLNELANIIAQKTDGIHSGLSIGGDRYPGIGFLQTIMTYERNPEIKMIVLLGEHGGVQELMVGEAINKGWITKPVIGWCLGTSADYFDETMQFGHAGASATTAYESAVFKNKWMKEKGGIHVPHSFEDLPSMIENVFNSLGLEKKEVKEPNMLKDDLIIPTFFSSISNELGDELTYNGVKISDVLKGDGILGKTIGHLWLKKEIPMWLCKYIEMVLVITADHGGMVSGAHNTIVASRAGKDMISSLCSGLLTIGDRFGGALNDSAKMFYEGLTKGETPSSFVSRMRRENRIIMGIGHKIKTKENPDIRVVMLSKFIESEFPEDARKLTEFAFGVESITLQKKNNLILNVDGLIAVSMVDAFMFLFRKEEVEEILENELMNAFFVLGRSIGFIGHWYDQRRLKQGLFRLSSRDIQYID